MEQGVSIVVPTKGRVRYLEQLLISLEVARERTTKPVQIIIVDDSSEKEAELIRTLCESHGAEYFYYHGGISDKRNFGVTQADFPIILFIDSDCWVHPSVIQEHLRSYTNGDIGGCLGITEFKGDKKNIWNVVEKMPFLYPYQFAKHLEYVPWGPCTNISFKKEVLDKVGGFASILPPKEGGEDVDLGYRIQRIGYKIKCNSKAIVYHTRETWGSWNALIERAFRWGRAECYLLIRHQKNSYLEIPKPVLLFSILLIISLYGSFMADSFSLILFPFLWLLMAILIQGLFVSYRRSSGSFLKEAIYSSLSIMVDFIFELGMMIECLRRGKMQLALLKFVYVEGQPYTRWHWGIIKTWSYVVALLVSHLIFTSLFLHGAK